MKYFNVFIRKINKEIENISFDFLFYDVTELTLSKKFIKEESIKKQKSLAKVAHEFKTPLYSLVGLINIITKNLSMLKKNINVNIKDIMNNLTITENLGKYILFLTSDIIYYNNPEEIKKIKIQNTKIYIKEILNFCYEILKCLLKCNISKDEKIKVNCFIEENIEKYIIFSDELRVKQILLNFISNSVKFTNKGFINLYCEKVKNEDFIKITVKDSGMGIKEIEKIKLFEDFMMINNNDLLENKNNPIKTDRIYKDNYYNIFSSNGNKETKEFSKNTENICFSNKGSSSKRNNNELLTSENRMGSGLGLSICKLIAEKINCIIDFESKYSVGSLFYLMIPIKPHSSQILSNFSRKKNMLNLPFSSPNNIKEVFSSKNLITIFNKSKNLSVKYLFKFFYFI